MRHSQVLRVSLFSAACLAGLSTGANAAGFYIQEQSVRGLGAAFSGSTTTLDDASTIYFNPGGMTQLEGLQLQAGVNLLLPNSKVKNRGTTSGTGAGRPVGGGSKNPYDPSPVPNGFASYQVNDRLWAGIGVTAPYGLGSEYDDGWFGRFDSTKTELTVMDVQPTVAYKINDWISVGAGVNIQRASADLRNAQVLGAGVEGNSQLKGQDWAAGYSFGVQMRPWESTTLGFSYKSAVHHDLDGSLRVTNAAGAVVASATSSGKAKLTTPDHATFGLAHKLNDRWTLQGQATWFGWNNFGEIDVRRDGTATADPAATVQDYQNTWAFAVGAEYLASDEWKLRGGVQFDQTPTTDEFRTSRTPDGDRTWLALGATYSMTPQIDLDVAATYIHVESGTINVARGGGRTIASTEGNVGIIAAGVSYKF
jgi:long-chain fatty acid transport protein